MSDFNLDDFILPSEDPPAPAADATDATEDTEVAKPVTEVATPLAVITEEEEGSSVASTPIVSYEPGGLDDFDPRATIQKLGGVAAVVLVIIGVSVAGAPVPIALAGGAFIIVAIAFGMTVADRRRSGADIRQMLSEGSTEMQKTMAATLLASLEGGEKQDNSVRALLRRSGSRMSAAKWLLMAVPGALALAAVQSYLLSTRVSGPVDMLSTVIANRLGSGASGTTGQMLGVVFLALQFFASFKIIKAGLAFKAKRRSKKFDNGLPLLLEAVSASMKAGQSFIHAMESSASESTNEPIRTEVLATLGKIDAGANASDEWLRLANVMDSRGMLRTVQAYEICNETGGPLADVLGKVAASVRDIQEILAEVNAKAAQGRIAAMMMVILTPGIGLYMLGANRDYILTLFRDPIGWGLLTVGTISLSLGMFFMKRLTTFDG